MFRSTWFRCSTRGQTIEHLKRSSIIYNMDKPPSSKSVSSSIPTGVQLDENFAENIPTPRGSGTAVLEDTNITLDPVIDPKIRKILKEDLPLFVQEWEKDTLDTAPIPEPDLNQIITECVNEFFPNENVLNVNTEINNTLKLLTPEKNTSNNDTVPNAKFASNKENRELTTFIENVDTKNLQFVPFECTICRPVWGDKPSFVTQLLLIEHLEEEHGIYDDTKMEKLQIICEFRGCFQMFCSKAMFKEHSCQVHQTHQLRHEVNYDSPLSKPIVCSVCKRHDEFFASTLDLEKHLEDVHGIYNENNMTVINIQCQDENCSHIFVDEESYINHWNEKHQNVYDDDQDDQDHHHEHETLANVTCGL